MRILQVINDFSSGGAQKLVCDYAPIMQERGHDVTVILLRSSTNVFFCNLAEHKLISLSFNSLYSIATIFKLNKYIREGQYDIIHVHLFPSLYLVAFVAMFVKRTFRLIYTEHSTSNRRRSSKLFKIFDTFVYSRYDSVISISEKVRQNLLVHTGECAQKYPIVFNGVNLASFSSPNYLMKSDLYNSYSIEHKILVMVGRFTDAKDQETIIRCLNILDNNHHLLLIGEGPLRSKCENLVQELGLNDRVHFLGVRNDIPNILRLCDIGILSSHWEGLPLAAIEIMAAGLPFLGSDVPGINEFCEHNKDLLFSESDELDLANRIHKLIIDSEYYEDMVQLSLKTSQKYSIENMVDGYLEHYESLVV